LTAVDILSIERLGLSLGGIVVVEQVCILVTAELVAEPVSQTVSGGQHQIRADQHARASSRARLLRESFPLTELVSLAQRLRVDFDLSVGTQRQGRFGNKRDDGPSRELCQLRLRMGKDIVPIVAPVDYRRRASGRLGLTMRPVCAACECSHSHERMECQPGQLCSGDRGLQLQSIMVHEFLPTRRAAVSTR
jgi:hypothetical protein